MQIIAQNTVTMSSLEMAESIVEGTASKADAYEAAFLLIGNAAIAMDEYKNHDIESMSARDAREALDSIESGRETLRCTIGAFEKYPFAHAAIEAQISVMFYAEATLIPFYMLGNRDAIKRSQGLSSTYIVKHPLTGLIKIGRANNVDQRIKSLQTGAGAILTTLAVIPDDVERDLHNRFSAYRRHGEWFDDVDGVISTFASECKGAAL